MNRVLTGVIAIMFFMWVGVLSAEQKEIIGKDGAPMVLIPAGEFPTPPFGSGSGPYYPQNKVRLSAYYIDKYEVTVAQYLKFCETTGRKTPHEPLWGWQDNHPIVYVSWYDADAYAKYYGKRLPTAAEWVVAAWAGSTTKYCFGDSETDLKDYAWYGEHYDKGTHPVGTKKPNAFGLYDMHGNVSEWCSDRHATNYYDGKWHDMCAYCGGSYASGAFECRAMQGSSSATNAEIDCGFRCASSP